MTINDHLLTEQQRQHLEEQQQIQPLAAQVEDNLYVHRQFTMEELEQDNRAEHAIKEGIGNIRQAVKAVMPDVYTTVDQIRTSPNIDMRAAHLHHSRGTQLADRDGTPVLEFNMAGSSYSLFHTEHKGFNGKSKEVMARVGFENNVKKEEEIKVKLHNRLFGWLPFVNSVKQIEEKNRLIRAKNRIIEHKVEKQYGTSTVVNMGKITSERLRGTEDGQAARTGATEDSTRELRKLEHVRTKIKGNKTKISMSGPQGLGGISNSGDYSIENLRVYMLQLGSQYLKNIFDNWIENNSTPKEVHILIKGHSRGGVASVEGAMMIKHWVSENYPEYENFVKFDLTQYDPVPGTGSRTDTHVKADHLSTETITDDGHKMKPLGDSAETTVVYSIHSNHNVFFIPQQVEGAKRIILTPFTHDVGLDASEETVAENGALQSHRAAYTNATDGEVYRSSGFADLGRGVYIVDENNTLVRFDNYGQVESVLQKVQLSGKQAERHQIMLDVARHWFDVDRKRAENAPQGS